MVRRGRTRWLGALVVLAVLGGSLAALAQGFEGGSGRTLVLHEYFDANQAFLPASDEALATAAQEAHVGSVVHDGVQIPRPASNLPLPGLNEVRHGTDGPSDAQSGRALPRQNGPGNANPARMRLDDDTDMEGELNYRTVFNPSVVPFKRGGAMDRVVRRRGRYEVEVGDRSLRTVPIGPDEGVVQGRDRFWGSLLVEARPGELIPIPSVAAGARILSVETSPLVSIEFVTDGADNMAVRLGHSGPVRINFITDASRRYFGSDIPSGISLAAPPSDFPGTFSPLDAELEPVAETIAAAIGVSRADPLHEALPRLVEYFRDFEPVELDDASRVHGDLMLDITLGKRGVCRHRAFGFLLVAQYLNIPTRYVYNEAHAFVEVFVSLRGWIRIDLGGGAEQLTVASDARNVRHDGGDDPFPQPRRYTENYSRVARDEPAGALGGFQNVTGLPQLPDEIDALAPGFASDGTFAPGGGSGAGGAATGSSSSEQGAASTAAASDDSTSPSADATTSPTAAADDALMSAPATSQPTPGADTAGAQAAGSTATAARVRPVLTLEGMPDTVLRGSPLELHGSLRVADGDVPLDGRAVQIVLAPVGETQGELRILDTVSTDALGNFSAQVRLPQTLPVGRWDLYARFPGDLDWTETRSR